MKPNLNEIRDYKYVDKAELQAMFNDSGMWTLDPVLASESDLGIANSFTPWFKLIARDFLFGWWDELLARRGSNGLVDAKSLNGIVDGSKVVSMV